MKAGDGSPLSSVSFCSLLPAPLRWPHPSHLQVMGASGWARQGATQETGNHDREREEAMRVRGGGGGGHDVPQLPQSF